MFPTVLNAQRRLERQPEPALRDLEFAALESSKIYIMLKSVFKAYPKHF